MSFAFPWVFAPRAPPRLRDGVPGPTTATVRIRFALLFTLVYFRFHQIPAPGFTVLGGYFFIIIIDFVFVCHF